MPVAGATVAEFVLETSALVAPGSLLSVSVASGVGVAERVGSGLAASGVLAAAPFAAAPVACATGAAGVAGAELEAVSVVEPPFALAKRVTAPERAELEGSFAEESLPEGAVDPLLDEAAPVWLEGCVTCVAGSAVAVADDVPASLLAGCELAGEAELSVSTSAGLVALRLTAGTGASARLAPVEPAEVPSFPELPFASAAPEEKSFATAVELVSPLELVALVGPVVGAGLDGTLASEVVAAGAVVSGVPADGELDEAWEPPVCVPGVLVAL